MFKILKSFLEIRVFGVSSWISDVFSINVSLVRIFFIYAAFTNTLVVLIYLTIMFFMKIFYHFRYRKRKSVFDL
tara:strand:- start:5734 stop:5955 length:222 start_codon:yes stop_codon:yes gene_type:complete